MRAADPKQMSKTDLRHWSFAVDAYKMFESDLISYVNEGRNLPRGWDEIWEEQDKRDPKRVKITISLDDDVLRFFKGLGPGYQPRMNRVLRAFMHFRLAKIIDGPDTTDYILKPEKVLEEFMLRPDWGDTKRQMDELTEQSRKMDEKLAQSGPGKGRPGVPRKRVLKEAARAVDDPFADKGWMPEEE